ncbi:MAG: Ni/Fe hydrogenase subunit alpha [Gemmatales bacterium]|nr:Ni/Fe hydrogenase subunit alpha [Gemmatales bacterium]MDW8385817.1 Ni/Fe hydrogenase subunit alpha [Gemmatales bacterium]
MSRRIIIDPVTRIEGHAKISIFLDDSGSVADAWFHVAEYRGFEKFCEGRPLAEMAGITARVCGICPVSHLLASVKAADRILAVSIPPAAVKLRRLLNLAQIVQSHALSFFHLSAPDLLLGFDSEPTKRNIFGLASSDPETARGGIRLRQFGQEIIEALGGQKIHPAWVAPGGVRGPLSAERRTYLQGRLPEAISTVQRALGLMKQLLDRYPEETQSFGNFPTLFLGLVGPEGVWEHYDGFLRITDSTGNIVADGLDPARYQDFLGEAVETWSYLKSPYYKPLGYPDGIYRVGPLARLNICSRLDTPLADRELSEYRQRVGGAATSSFYYHYARLIEILTSLERIGRLLDDPDVLSLRYRARAGINQLEGVGCSEAPRGTLFHHYLVNEDGLIQKVNLLIATGQNNLAMNRTVAQIAKHWIRGPDIPEGVLNRIEAGIRAFDPCLSCSTHALGRMPLVIEVRDSRGTLLGTRRRDATS